MKRKLYIACFLFTTYPISFYLPSGGTETDSQVMWSSIRLILIGLMVLCLNYELWFLFSHSKGRSPVGEFTNKHPKTASVLILIAILNACVGLFIVLPWIPATLISIIFLSVGFVLERSSAKLRLLKKKLDKNDHP